MKHHIKSNDHVFVAGRTGSGKTFLVRKYLPGYEYVAVLDTKGLMNWEEIPKEELTVINQLHQLDKVKTKKVIYRPSFNEMEIEYYDTFFKWVYQRGNTNLWIDELMSVCENATSIPEYLKACYTRGRELGIGVWGLSQRPKMIPIVCMSEATHFFIFDLNIVEDRDRLVKIAGAEDLYIRPSYYSKRCFWYYHVEWDEPKLAELIEEGG